jgi:hypothetical protein
MDITMSRVHLASDTCDIYFTYIKVNHPLYTCSLDLFEDGILLETSPMCMHRYCQTFTDVKEECKRKCTSTPSTREVWKRRRKKGEEEVQVSTCPDDPDDARISRPPARMIRLMHLKTPEGSTRSRIIRTSTGIIQIRPNIWTSTRTSGPPMTATTRPDDPDPRSPDHPDNPPDHPNSACVHDVGPRPMYPLHPLTYPFVA